MNLQSSISPRAIAMNRSSTDRKRDFFSLAMLPVGTAAILLLMAGCNSAPERADIPKYNAEGTPPPERMEQFHSARTGKPVYRFCVGSECPQPTPKKPIPPRRATVTEIEPDGTRRQASQVIQPGRPGTPTGAQNASGGKRAERTGKKPGPNILARTGKTPVAMSDRKSGNGASAAPDAQRPMQAGAVESAQKTPQARAVEKAGTVTPAAAPARTPEQSATRALEEARRAAAIPVPTQLPEAGMAAEGIAPSAPAATPAIAPKAPLRAPENAPVIPGTGTRIPDRPAA